MFPVALCGAFRYDESLTKCTPVSWCGWETLSKIACTLDSIRSSNTAVREFSSTPRTSMADADQFVESVGIRHHQLTAPAYDGKRDCTCHQRLVEHPQHCAADVEGPRPPQKTDNHKASVITVVLLNQKISLWKPVLKCLQLQRCCWIIGMQNKGQTTTAALCLMSDLRYVNGASGSCRRHGELLRTAEGRSL